MANPINGVENLPEFYLDDGPRQTAIKIMENQLGNRVHESNQQQIQESIPGLHVAVSNMEKIIYDSSITQAGYANGINLKITELKERMELIQTSLPSPLDPRPGLDPNLPIDHGQASNLDASVSKSKSHYALTKDFRESLTQLIEEKLKACQEADQESDDSQEADQADQEADIASSKPMLSDSKEISKTSQTSVYQKEQDSREFRLQRSASCFEPATTLELRSDVIKRVISCFEPATTLESASTVIERVMYNAATNQEDYLRRIALQMLVLEMTLASAEIESENRRVLSSRPSKSRKLQLACSSKATDPASAYGRSSESRAEDGPSSKN